MSIPLDYLYCWVESCVSTPVTLYIFQPHGSKNISDLKPFKTKWEGKNPSVVCHDQEPLNFKNFEFEYDKFCQIIESDCTLKNNLVSEEELRTFYEAIIFFVNQTGLTPNFLSYYYFVRANQGLLLHSEKNSLEVEKFKNDNFIPVYYWAHAVIALDWYRFAKHDSRLLLKNPKKTFLVYSRDWSDGREYRLKFIELLIKHSLLKQSTVSIKKINDNNQSIKQFIPTNKKFSIDYKLFEELNDNPHQASSSAYYNHEDFCNHHISVVLETMFDDQRVHLTEKSLRPIACGHPFLLAAGPHSLEYLRSYGFKTFSPWINEEYDLEPDSYQRMVKIIDSMNDFVNLPEDKQKNALLEINKIAEYNKRHFFSDEFFTQVKNELTQNFNDAVNQLQATPNDRFLLFRKILKKQKEKFLPLLRSNFHKTFISNLTQSRKKVIQL